MHSNDHQDDFTRIDRDGITLVRLERQVSVERVMAIAKAVAESDATDRRVWNVGSHFDFGASDIRLMSRMSMALFSGPARVAFVATELAYFGLLRMFEMLREVEEGYEIRVFREEAAAIEWVSSAD